jgi:hypothetical protein
MNTYIDTFTEISTDSKYRRWYLSIITRAKTRASTKKEAKNILGGYTEAHHILPKSFELGGDKDSNNLVYLSAQEHFVCHLLLTKIFTEGEYCWKMNSALSYFMGKNKNFKGRRILTGWEYEQCRKARAISSSESLSREVEINGIRYKNSSIAAAQLGMTREIITSRILSGAYPTWYHTDGKTIKDNRTKPFKEKAKKIVIEDNTYSSIWEASRVLGLSVYIIGQRLKSVEYTEYGYLDGTPKTVTSTVKVAKCKSIMVNGVIYDSVREASRITGISRGGLNYKACNPKCLEYYWVSDTIEQKTVIRPGAPGRQVIVNDITYQSLADAARVVECSVSTIANRANSNKHPEYKWVT